MKMKRFFVTLLTIVMACSLMLTACGSKEPATLEESIAKDTEVQEEFNEVVASAEEQGVKVEVKGNEIVYTFDITGMDGLTEELATSDELKTTLTEAMNAQADTFKDIAANLSEETGISGISVVVNYMYGDEMIATGTFTPDSE